MRSERIRGVERPLEHRLPWLRHHAVDFGGQNVAQDQPADGVVHGAHLLADVAVDAVEGRATAAGQAFAGDEAVLVVLAHAVAVEQHAGSVKGSRDGALPACFAHQAVDFVQDFRLRAAAQICRIGRVDAGEDVQLTPQIHAYASAVLCEPEELLALWAKEPPVRRVSPRDEGRTPLTVAGREPPLVPVVARNACDDQASVLEGFIARLRVRHVGRDYELAVARLSRQRLPRFPGLLLVECRPAPAIRQSAGVEPDLRKIRHPNISHGRIDLPLSVRWLLRILLYNKSGCEAISDYCFWSIFRLNACIL